MRLFIVLFVDMLFKKHLCTDASHNGPREEVTTTTECPDCHVSEITSKPLPKWVSAGRKSCASQNKFYCKFKTTYTSFRSNPAHAHLVDKSAELALGKSFCQAVGNHLRGWDVGQVDSSREYLVSDVIMLDVDVLGSCMEDWIMSKCSRSLIIPL